MYVRESHMRIGMSLTTGYSRNRDPSELMDSLVEQVELMAELGFDSLSLGDHHVTRDHYFQVLPTMSRMSAHAANMELLPLFLLPFYKGIIVNFSRGPAFRPHRDIRGIARLCTASPGSRPPARRPRSDRCGS